MALGPLLLHPSFASTNAMTFALPAGAPGKDQQGRGSKPASGAATALARRLHVATHVVVVNIDTWVQLGGGGGRVQCWCSGVEGRTAGLAPARAVAGLLHGP